VFDANKNGSLKKADFDKAEIFSKLDFDGDGKIMKNDYLNLVADFYLSDNPQSPGNLFFGAYE
jgi:hypothetical protein